MTLFPYKMYDMMFFVKYLKYRQIYKRLQERNVNDSRLKRDPISEVTRLLERRKHTRRFLANDAPSRVNEHKIDKTTQIDKTFQGHLKFQA